MKIKWLSLVRILGLAMVLVYHFYRGVLPGGFFGVDLFFTLSGYLTTALLIEEFRKTGGFKFFAFMKRRFLRIFPPLCLSVLITLPFALLISPDFIAGIARQAAGALGFVTNYLEILTGGAYEAQLLPHLYIHTWSLALEMHYYLLWGLAALAATFLVWGLVKDEARKLRILKISLALPAVLLAGFCWWNMQRLFDPGNPTRAYFDSTSHALPFFIGSALGALFGLRVGKKTAKRLNNRLTAALSVAAMVLATGSLVAMGLRFSFNGESTYRYGFLLAALLAAAIICAARALHEATPKLPREPRVVTFFAETSYGVFLFHWPLYVVFSNVFAQNWLASLLTFAISLGLASMTFYGLEPVLHGKKPWKRHHVLLKTLYPAAGFLVLLGIAGSAQVFARAPVINDLETPIMVGNIYQDAESVAALEKRVAAIPAEPVKDRGRPLFWADAVHDPSLAEDDAWTPSVTIDSIPGGVSFLGDSVSLGADRLLRRAIPGVHVDSAVSRLLKDGRELLLEWQADGSLREVVVIALGANDGGGEWQAQIDGMLEELPAGCRVVFVTPYLGRPAPGLEDKAIASYFRQLAQELPYVTVADWASIVAKNPDYLASDHTHLGGEKAAQAYVNTVLQAIAEAGGKEGKR